jgi:hypothetical protein
MKKKHDEQNRVKVAEFEGELDSTNLKCINDYDKVLFAHNAMMECDRLNATKRIMKEFNISQDRANKYMTLAREARSIVLANKGNLEQQITEAVTKFEYHRQKAIELNDIRAANEALKNMGQLLQLYVNRVEVEVTTKDFTLNWGKANIQDAIVEEIKD